MELNNKTTIIIVVAVICLTFILGTALYLNSGGEINPLSQTICAINVGSNHSDEKVIVEVLYSRDGANLNDGDKVEKTVDSEGSIVCESKDSYDKYPDHAIVTLYDLDGNVLDKVDVSLATDDSTQVAIGNGTVTAKSITQAEHSASDSKSGSSGKRVTEWVEDLDLSDKAGYDCHVYIHHRSDGTKYYIDEDGKKHSAPESQEWVF